MKRFKGLDPIDMMPEELWTEACNTVQEAVVKTIPSFKKQKQKQKQNKLEDLMYLCTGHVVLHVLLAQKSRS